MEYSNRIYDEYVQFYVRRGNSSVMWGPKLSKDLWLWTDFIQCNKQYTAEASKCSYLAPFDNQMTLWMDLAVEESCGGNNVVEEDYQFFQGSGVDMEISNVVVFKAMNKH